MKLIPFSSKFAFNAKTTNLMAMVACRCCRSWGCMRSWHSCRHWACTQLHWLHCEKHVFVRVALAANLIRAWRLLRNQILDTTPQQLFFMSLCTRASCRHSASAVAIVVQMLLIRVDTSRWHHAEMACSSCGYGVLAFVFLTLAVGKKD